jgi:hypothetical protein
LVGKKDDSGQTSSWCLIVESSNTHQRKLDENVKRNKSYFEKLKNVNSD